MLRKALSSLLFPLALAALAQRPTLEVWIMPNTPNAAEDLKALVAPFERDKGVEVKVTVLDWGVAWTRITAAATSGVGPDLTQLGTTWVGAVSAMGALEPLDDVLEALGGQGAYLPAVWNTTRLAGAKEATAVPWFSELRAFY
ncbi:MAG: extracellular solute-binding protein, partial [Thermus sp.]